VRGGRGFGRRASVADNTIILFTGDNGTDQRVTTDTRRGPVQGGKGLMTDGGTHVPLVALYPRRTTPGAVRSDLIDFSDFLPTLAEAAGTSLPKDRRIDGISFLPQLSGQKGKPRSWVFCHYWGFGRRKKETQEFVRNARWKLYGDGRFGVDFRCGASSYHAGGWYTSAVRCQNRDWRCSVPVRESARCPHIRVGQFFSA